MTFDFPKNKIVTNVEQLRVKVTRLVIYGVTMYNMQVAKVILANVDKVTKVTKHEYGHVFCTAIQTIRRKFT